MVCVCGGGRGLEKDDKRENGENTLKDEGKTRKEEGGRRGR